MACLVIGFAIGKCVEKGWTPSLDFCPAPHPLYIHEPRHLGVRHRRWRSSRRCRSWQKRPPPETRAGHLCHRRSRSPTEVASFAGPDCFFGFSNCGVSRFFQDAVKVLDLFLLPGVVAEGACKQKSGWVWSVECHSGSRSIILEAKVH